ncbi:MAG TPA: protein kinase [Ktedonobacteraceae bacterium]|nr:protein kinase [Ktedonobacteraceae bacterium]
MPLPIGSILDRKFKIVQVLGEGGMGTVYKVEQLDRPGRFWAVKELLINPNTPEDERKSAIERFNKEIDLLYNLKNPRIPSISVSFQERGNYYFVMEFVPGKSLEKILEETSAPLEEQKVVRWMMQVCEALSYIHTRVPPIILRDLKPGNIMVTPDDNVQLIDFGIARRFDPNKRTNTENLGTISYASPEHLGSITAPGQRRSAQNPGRLVQTDARSDIYSLGATMYHLLTNHEPEPIQTPAPGSILARNPRLHTIQVNGRVICPVEQVIIKAMQQEPAQRFQSAEAMRMALAQCLPAGSVVAPTTVQIPSISANSTIMVTPQAPPIAAANIICPKCGLANRPGAKFCKRDGQPLNQGARAAPPPQINRQPLNQNRRAVPPQQASRQPLRARPVQSVGIQARPVTRQSIQARPLGTSVATQAQTPQSAYRLALQNLNNKKYVEAIDLFKRAAVPGQTSYEITYGLGRAYRQYAHSLKSTDQALYRENLKLAIEQFEQAVKIKADAVDSYFQLGMSYHDLELYDQANATFTKVQQLTPHDAAVYFQLGKIAMEQGYNLEAEAYFLEGLKHNPNHALILASLGKLYLKMNQAQNAINVLRQATQLEPLMWESWYELGRAHMKARQWKLALSALEQARQSNPDADEIYSAMATCYVKTNKKAEARDMVRQSLMINPSNNEATRLQKQL